MATESENPVHWPVSVVTNVAWGDMDALGHVNNTHFFRWFESARIRLFEHLGIRAIQPLAIGPILATASCDFLKPIHYPNTVVTSARVARIGETSMGIDYEIRDEGNSEIVYARGTSVIVMIDYQTGAKVRVPEDVRIKAEAAAIAKPSDPAKT